MEYDKYATRFVMLEGQNSVFALRETLPIKGHIKIETGSGRGTIRVVVQNMRHYEKGLYIYKLIFFGKKKERTIHKIMGTVNVNKYGNGETYLKFNPLDIDEKGSKLSDYKAAFVVAVSLKNEKEALHPVMKGNIDTGGNAENEDFFANEQRKTFNTYYNKFLMESCEKAKRMARYYDDAKPFETDKTNAEWKKIMNTKNMPVVSPGAHYFAAKYKHYIFGTDENRCYIGIPGRFIKEEQPDSGESGFVYWQPQKDAEYAEDAHGYWITAVNPATGDIEEI